LNPTGKKDFAGRFRGFYKNQQALLNWASFLVEADEAAFALTLLEKGVPGYFRDNPTKEMVNLRRTIRRQLMTTADYIKNDADDPCDDETAKLSVEQLHRAGVVEDIIKDYNERDIKPHVVDLGPGDYWLPLGLKQRNAVFTYRPVSVQPTAKITSKRPIKRHSHRS